MKFRRIFCIMLFSLCLILISVPALVNANSDLIAAADELYAKRINPENVQKAINLLKQAATENPKNSGALWRLARLYWVLGDRAAVKKEKIDYFTQGQEYARQATEANPNELLGHYWLASLIGSLGDAKGILQSLFMVKPMKNELDFCIKLDPKFAGAHDVLAQLYWLAPGPPLSIGNKKLALEEIKLAVAYNPSSIEFQLHLGQIARDNKDFTMAREAFQKALTLPDDPEDLEASKKFKATATEELKKLEGK